MFNFTEAEKKALIFTIIILLVSGIYQLISPHKNLQPSYDYFASDSVFKRLNTTEQNDLVDSIKFEPLEIKSKNINIKKKKTVKRFSPIKEKPLFSSVNINTASENELQKLPLIGPVKAKLIIDYRNKNGKFNNIDDLLKIKGIGTKTLEKLNPFIIIN
jgi:competence protein ComEA